MKKEEEIIDLEEINGVYTPKQDVAKNNRKPKQVNYTQYKNIKITNNVHNKNKPQESLTDLVDGFNEGMRLINNFMKLIR